MRSQLLSTQKLKTYQCVMLMVWLSFLVTIVFVALNQSNSFLALYWPLYWCVGFYLSFIKRTLRLKGIEYDDENVYVVQKGQDFMIPFLNVKELKLTSVTGLHVISLYRDSGLGKEIWFKSSLWYPFNFKKVDNEVYRLRLKIEKVKSKYYENPVTSLPSQTG